MPTPTPFNKVVLSMTNQATLHKEWLLSMMYQLDIPFSILLSDLVLGFSIFYLQLQRVQIQTTATTELKTNNLLQ